MIQVSSGRASNARGHVTPRGRFVRLLSYHPAAVAAAILILASGFNMTSRAYAQPAESPADCVANCKAEAKQCIHNGSSEELCEYDDKMCQKACTESK